MVCAFCGNNHFLSQYPIKKDDGTPICHRKGDHVSCAEAYNIFMKVK